jgi:hypothetical protein
MKMTPEEKQKKELLISMEILMDLAKSTDKINWPSVWYDEFSRLLHPLYLFMRMSFEELSLEEKESLKLEYNKTHEEPFTVFI